jgi:hypothetical protein
MAETLFGIVQACQVLLLHSVVVAAVLYGIQVHEREVLEVVVHQVCTVAVVALLEVSQILVVVQAMLLVAAPVTGMVLLVLVGVVVALQALVQITFLHQGVVVMEAMVNCFPLL